MGWPTAYLGSSLFHPSPLANTHWSTYTSVLSVRRLIFCILAHSKGRQIRLGTYARRLVRICGTYSKIHCQPLRSQQLSVPRDITLSHRCQGHYGKLTRHHGSFSSAGIQIASGRLDTDKSKPNKQSRQPPLARHHLSRSMISRSYGTRVSKCDCPFKFKPAFHDWLVMPIAVCASCYFSSQFSGPFQNLERLQDQG